MDQTEGDKSTLMSKRRLVVTLAFLGTVALSVLSITFYALSVEKAVCNANCPSKEPVCGQDGFWYANSCIAACANVRTAQSPHLCGSAPRTVSPSQEDLDKILDFSALLKRHADKGFHYIGQLDHHQADATAAPSPPQGYSWESQEAAKQTAQAASASTVSPPPLAHDIPGAWIVIEDDGSVYVKNEDNDNAESVEATLTAEYWGESAQTAGSPHGCGKKAANISYTPPDPQGNEYISSSGPGRKLLVQGGFDSRKQILDSTDSYHKQVGELWPIGCSGALVGPSHVLTAGHCLWGRMGSRSYGEDGTWRRSEEFYAGRTSDNSFTGHSRITRKIIHRQYRQLHEDEFDWDYGLAVLEKPLGAELGWMGMKFDCAPGYTKSYESGMMSLTVAGYPADKPLHTMWEDKCSNIASGCFTRSVVHHCDTAPGMSGSAMLEHSANGPPVIRAVHVAGGPSGNRATLIQRSMFYAVTAWRAGADSCPMSTSSEIEDGN